MGAGVHGPDSSFRAEMLIPPAAGSVGCEWLEAESLSKDYPQPQRDAIPQSDD